MDTFPYQEFSPCYELHQPQRSFLLRAETFIQAALADVNQGKVQPALQNIVSGLQLYFVVLEKETDEAKTLALGTYVEQLLNYLEHLKSVSPRQPEEIHLMTLETASFFHIHPKTGERTPLEGSVRVGKRPQLNHLVIKGSLHEIIITEHTPCIAMGNGQYLIEAPHLELCFALQLDCTGHIIQEFESHFESHSVLKRVTPPQPEVVKPTHVEVAEDDNNDLDEWEKDFVIIESTEVVVEPPLPGSIFQTGIQDYHLNFMASGLEDVASKVAYGIAYGAQTVQKGILGTGESLKSKISSNPEQTEVSPIVGNTLYYVKQVTSTSARVTGAVVDKLSELSAELGIAVGNRVLEGFTGSDKEDHEKNPRIQALKNLAKSGLSAIGTVMDSIGDAGDAVFDAAAESTIGVLGHKYGEEVAVVTQDVFDAGKDVLAVASNVQSVAKPKKLIKSLGKNAAKETAKTVLLGVKSAPHTKQIEPSTEVDMDEVEAEVASFISISPRKSDSYSLLKNSNSISPRKGISIHQDTVVPSVSLQNTVPVYISSPQVFPSNLYPDPNNPSYNTYFNPYSPSIYPNPSSHLPESSYPVPEYTPQLSSSSLPISHSEVSPQSISNSLLFSSFPSPPQHTPTNDGSIPVAIVNSTRSLPTVSQYVPGSTPL